MIDLKQNYIQINFLNFLKDFLPKDFKSKNFELNLDDNNSYFKKATLLGSVESLKNLTIIEIERIKPEKNRVKITKELFKFLEIHGFKNALVITYSEVEDHYRLSLITSELVWASESKVKKIFSNPKRLSFLLGPEAKIQTAQKQLFKLGEVKDFKDLFDRFNVEIVSEEFYEEYKKLYELLCKYFEKDKDFKQFSIKSKLDISLLSKKILGQVTFCYFLQKKGWLGANKNEDFFKGSKNFLREKFNETIKNKKNYFNDFLEYLFYDGLNNDENINNYFNENLKCKIPFLNGGLFEPINNYDWKNKNLKIPNSLFSNNDKNGILDIFDLFNFTIDENQSNDAELAVDPEMLGKVYERLIDEALKKKYRPFYTHREVVNYMCTISLIKYLQNKFIDKLNFNEIEQLFDDSNNYLYSIKKEKENDDKKNYLNFLDKIDLELENILICDPAIGSGAFPVAMMNLVTNLREFISNKLKHNISRYEIKYNFIKNSIHGVDIDNSAVEIAKLRMWLSLIIEEVSIKKTSTLPNLQYRIVQGDSLVESYANFYFRYDLNKIGQGNLLQDEDYLEKEFKSLIKNQDEFYKSIYSSKKNKLKEKIKSQMENIVFSAIENSGEKEKKRELLKSKFSKSLINNNYHNFFPWRLVFANVFFKKDGFDIIIGNPPYTESRSKDFDEDKKKLYLQEIKNKWHKTDIITKGSDLMTYFFPLSLELMNGSGVNTLITSNSWLSTNYGKKLQSFLLESSHTEEIIDSDFRYFPKGKGPDVNTVISIIQKKKKPNNHLLKYIKIKDRFNNLDSFELQNKDNIQIKKFQYLDKKLNSFKWGLLFECDNWLIDIFEKLQKNKKESNYSIGQGLNLSKNCIIGEEQVDQLKINKKYLIPFTSKEISYSTSYGQKYLLDKNLCSKDIKDKAKKLKIELFDFSKTTKEPPKLFLPRGVADKHYCTLNTNNSFTDSAVDIYFNKEFNDYEERLLNFWVFLNSSIFKLYRELSGRKSLGGGLLKAEATDLVNFEIYHELNNFKKIDKLFQKFKEKEVRNIEDTLNDKDYIILDNIVMEHLNITKHADKIRNLLINRINLRHKKSTT